MLHGNPISVEDMMACRDNRVRMQTTYRMQYQKPVISFCMNIPGPIKTTPLIRKAFDIGCKEINKSLQANKIKIPESNFLYKSTGDEWILSADGDAAKIKELMSTIENVHPLGRLFDIDVIDVHGEKLSRSVFRKCLICEGQAQACACAREHSVLEMQDKTEEILNYFFNKNPE